MEQAAAPVVRESWASTLVAAAAPTGVMLIQLVDGLLLPRTFVLNVVAPVVLGVLLALAVTLRRRARFVLGEETATVVRFRRRHVAWRDVQAVCAEGGWGTGHRIVLWTSTGPVRLLIGYGRRDQTRILHAVGQWWLAHRGADWRPQPPVYAGPPHAVPPYAGPPYAGPPYPGPPYASAPPPGADGDPYRAPLL